MAFAEDEMLLPTPANQLAAEPLQDESLYDVNIPIASATDLKSMTSSSHSPSTDARAIAVATHSTSPDYLAREHHSSAVSLKHGAQDQNPAPRALKRHCVQAAPLTPPSTRASPPPHIELPETGTSLKSGHDTITRGLHVLQTEALALAHTTRLYETSADAQASLLKAVEAIVASQHGEPDVERRVGRSRDASSSPDPRRTISRPRGKVVLCGVGKSALVAEKTTATMRSLGIRSTFMHATEAVHGDLGDICDDDVLIVQSYSGKTPELMTLLPHIPTDIPLIIISCHTHAADVPLFRARAALSVNTSTDTNTSSSAPSRSSSPSPVPPSTSADDLNMEGLSNLAKYNILLPAPVHEPEDVSFGVNAPTSSTTVAMAIGDMLALTVAERLYGGTEGGVSGVFRRNHPGGAIGEDLRKSMGRG